MSKIKLIIEIDKELFEKLNKSTEEWACRYVEGWQKSITQAIINGTPYEERPKGEWGKWVITEIQCPNCLEYFQADCYSMEELQKCPNCEADMRRKGV